jgi:hypothetical protein
MPRGVSLYDEAQLQGRLWHPLLDPIRPVALWDPLLESSFSFDSTGIITWTDRVSGIVATSPSGSRPTYSRTARNGARGVLFNGSQYLAFTPPSSFPSGIQLGAVVLSGYLRTTTGTGRWAFVYGAGNSNAGLARYITHSDQFTAQGLGYVVAGTSGSGSNLTTAEMWTGQDRFVISQYGPGQSLVANVDGLGTESATLSPTTNTGLVAGRIGGWAYYGNPWDGAIHSILVYPPAITLPPLLTAKLAGWDSWTTGKNGRNLPAFSLFRNRPPLIGD